MKFTKHPNTGRNVVRGYTDSTVKIGEHEVRGSCAFNATDLIENWPPTRTSDLTLAHLEPVLAWQPEIILLGTGARQSFPSSQLIASVMARGVGLEVMDTGAACRTYNVLVSEDRRVVAALLVNNAS